MYISVRLHHQPKWISWETPLLKANYIKAKPEYATVHIDKPQSFKENVLFTDEIKLELLGKAHQLYGHRCKNETHQEQCSYCETCSGAHLGQLC